ncbi:hypothetical protein GCM10022277_28110 [Litoribacillus peritrichatus]|uniref:Transposase n=1 Tax=Litoribacillus peritrichatus TaxID=718191 RepID=A0ABP7MVJ9_9GAMM
MELVGLVKAQNWFVKAFCGHHGKSLYAFNRLLTEQCLTEIQELVFALGRVGNIAVFHCFDMVFPV